VQAECEVCGRAKRRLDCFIKNSDNIWGGLVEEFTDGMPKIVFEHWNSEKIQLINWPTESVSYGRTFMPHCFTILKHHSAATNSSAQFGKVTDTLPIYSTKSFGIL